MNKRLITVDIGNTNCSFAVWNREMSSISKSLIVPVVDIKRGTAAGFLKDLRYESFEAVISSVNPAAERAVRKALASIYNKDNIKIITLNKRAFEHITAKKNPPRLKSKYKGNIGIDRLLGALAVKNMFGKDAVIINMGTATTIDILINGIFEGGVILPGPDAMLSALNKAAKKIKVTKLPTPGLNPGSNTAACISNGIYAGTIFILKGFIETFGKKLKNPVVVIAGGRSLPYVKHLRPRPFYLPHLIHLGLSLYYKKLARM